MRRAALGLLLVVVMIATACDRDEPVAAVLDGSPRHPDAEGIVTEVDRERIVLDGGRSYRFIDELQSFSSQTMEPVSVLQRKGQYVHVGLDGDRVAWVAAVGSVLPGKPVVYYTGELDDVRGDELIFKDGTVLTAAEDLHAVILEGHVIAEIDPEARVVTALRAP